MSWKVKQAGEYNTRTEWHRIISWNKLGQWAAHLQKGAYVEVEGELRYREFTPAESDRSVRIAEIYASSILLLDRSDRQPGCEGLIQNLWRKQSINQIGRASVRIDARRFQR
jgi:single-strand DNA-binding protein